MPPPDSELHVPRASLHAALATAFGPAGAVEPVYVREPDATGGSRELSLRRLELGDLDAIERIERASYPTPWSRSMFAGRARKQSSLSIAAAIPDEQLVGYLVLSRYVDAWHVMNVAVDPDHRRFGIASAMLARLFEVTRDDAERGYTLEVRVSNLAAIALYESFGFVSRGVRRG